MNKEEKMYAHVERCAAGTQSQKSYCQEQGLSFATFQYWRRRYLKSRTSLSGFITIDSGRNVTPVIGRIEVVYPDGSRLSCGYDVPAPLLRSLIGR